MSANKLYSSGLVGLSDKTSLSFTVTAEGGNDNRGLRTATATLTIGAGTMMSRAVLSDDDARQLASELLKAASLIDDYLTGQRLNAQLNEQIEGNPERHLLGEPSSD